VSMMSGASDAAPERNEQPTSTAKAQYFTSSVLRSMQ
jgi:hypothetical protein